MMKAQAHYSMKDQLHPLGGEIFPDTEQSTLLCKCTTNTIVKRVKGRIFRNIQWYSL